jgi:NAD(P)-dependent dehydrogenase (short-subunit alcohol dehydrogenase family)
LQRFGDRRGTSRWKANALHLAANGMGGVVVTDSYEERAKRVAAEVEKLGCEGRTASCEVTDFAGVMGAFEQAVRALGRVDILINNAANHGPDPHNVSRKPWWEQSPNEWQPALGTNLFGVLDCTRAAPAGLIERGYRRIGGYSFAV